MKKKKDELTHLFRTRLENTEIPVREGFWEKLQQDIPVAVISRRRQTAYRFSAAASVLFMLAGASAAFWYFSPKEKIANAFTQASVSTGTAGKTGKDATLVSPAPAASSKSAVVTEERPDEGSFSVSYTISFSFSSSSSSTAGTQSRTANGYEENTSFAGRFDRDGHTDPQATEETSPDESVKGEKHGRTWSAGVFVSGGLLDSRTRSPHAVKHEQPFSVGLSVRKELSDRWGLESGCVYTRLKSERPLHYIGIPVKADLGFYKNKRVNLYASAGGMVEKCVGGDPLPAPLQFSLNTALGVQYKLTDRLSLYAEPGLSYHFDDGSPVVTVRKEKPLNINLLCGVRVTY
ncbi:MAG: porin family protein [Mediterranea sp.]|jgi:hypothetical protein|nr:porin family protein [Mediterranea sp.]